MVVLFVSNKIEMILSASTKPEAEQYFVAMRKGEKLPDERLNNPYDLHVCLKRINGTVIKDIHMTAEGVTKYFRLPFKR